MELEERFGPGRRHRRLNRRWLLRAGGLGGAGLTVALLTGCGGTEKPVAPVPAVQQPKRGGTITHMNAQETLGRPFDPHVSSPPAALGYGLFYQSLLGSDPQTYEVQPEIAQKWEQPSPTAYIFTLQPGIKWHDKPPANGRVLTAADVVFSLERLRSRDPAFVHRSLLDSVERIDAVDNGHVRLTMHEPDAGLLSKLSAAPAAMLAPEVVERAGRFATADTAVGTGAFIITMVEENVGAEYVRNPAYWKPGLPYVDRFRTAHFGSPGDERAYAAFLAGQLDMVVVPGTEVKRYIAAQGKDYTPLWYNEESGLWVTPNVKVKPFDDPRVTRALRLLIDHDEFKTAWAEVWAGRGRYGCLFPPALSAWDLPEEEYMKFLAWKQPKDEAVREALTLLAAAGFTRENPLRFELGGRTTSYFQAAAELLQAQWRRLGQGVVDTQLKLYDGTVVLGITARREFAYGIWPNSAPIVEPDTWFIQLYRTGGSRNYWNYSDPQLDAMIDKQRSLFDAQQRKAAIREIIAYANDHFPGVLGAGRLWLNAVKPYVRAFSPEFWLNGRQYEQVWLDI